MVLGAKHGETTKSDVVILDLWWRGYTRFSDDYSGSATKLGFQ